MPRVKPLYSPTGTSGFAAIGRGGDRMDLEGVAGAQKYRQTGGGGLVGGGHQEVRRAGVGAAAVAGNGEVVDGLGQGGGGVARAKGDARRVPGRPQTAEIAVRGAHGVLDQVILPIELGDARIA